MLEVYFHVSSFFGLLVILAVYLWIVLKIGPKFMENREAYNLKNVIRTYNIFQVIACTLIVVTSYKLGFTFKYLLKCETFEFLNDNKKLTAKIGCWLFLGLRIFEFIETIFFISRKKYNQASFLHIFHHVGTVVNTWLFIILHAGKDIILKYKFKAAKLDDFRTNGRLHCNHQL